MTTASSHIAGLAPLFEYPDQHYLKRLRQSIAELNASASDAACLAERFADAVVDLPLGELQELYSATFDLSPACSLDIGWHLYGEAYERGAFLATLREALDEAGIPENGELPDYLPRLVVLIERLDEPRARRLKETIRPGVQKLEAALRDKHSPYEHLVRAVMATLDGGG